MRRQLLHRDAHRDDAQRRQQAFPLEGSNPCAGIRRNRQRKGEPTPELDQRLRWTVIS